MTQEEFDKICEAIDKIRKQNNKILSYFTHSRTHIYTTEPPKIDAVAVNVAQTLPEHVPITEHEFYDVYLDAHRNTPLTPQTAPITKRSFNKIIRNTFEDEFTLKNTTRGGQQTRLWTKSTKN